MSIKTRTRHPHTTPGTSIADIIASVPTPRGTVNIVLVVRCEPGELPKYQALMEGCETTDHWTHENQARTQGLQLAFELQRR